MALLPPMFAQNRAYSARVLRRFVQALGPEGFLIGFETVPTFPVPTMAVLVSPGAAFIEGDDQADQGTYYIVSENLEPVPVPPADPINPRIDRVVLQVRDPQAGGPPGDDVILLNLTGVPSAVPEPQPVPDSALGVCDILVAPGTEFIVPQLITDIREFSPIAPGEEPTLGDLDDVELDDPTSLQFLQYDGTVWRNATVTPPLDPFFLMGA